MLEATAGLFLTNYVYQIPVFIVWIIAAIVAITRRRRHPRASLFLVIALGIFFLRALIMPVLSFAVVHSEMARAQAGMTQGLITIASALVATVAWSLLLAAALGWRERGEAK